MNEPVCSVCSATLRRNTGEGGLRRCPNRCLDRICPVPDCGGDLITRYDRTIACQRCGADPWVADAFQRRGRAANV